VPEYIRNPNTSCIICSKPIYRRPLEIKRNSGRGFCGQTCYGQVCRKEKPCIMCGDQIRAAAHKKTCSRVCSNRHRAGIQYKINRPHDKVQDQRSLKLRLFKQRGQACEKCGYNKYKILHTHHKDRNRKNNNLINLELLCPNCHAEEHHLQNH
jgi:hypothetical protein